MTLVSDLGCIIYLNVFLLISLESKSTNKPLEEFTNWLWQAFYFKEKIHLQCVVYLQNVNTCDIA